MEKSLTPAVAAKLVELRATIKSLDSLLIAFSGGVDSTFLSRVAHDVLGDRAVAVTARSETYPQWEYEEAISLAQRIGIRHVSIDTDEFHIEAFCNNPPDRCYHCKKELFGKLQALARDLGLRNVADGANADDVGDFRPGMRASAELGIVSPLKTVGFTKEEIRQASQALGLPTWDKPSYACLASRFPYGQRITPEALASVGAAEDFLRSLGLKQLRLRHHGDIARIEVPPQEIPRLASPELREKIVARLKELGFLYVTVDLQGYRTGSMNEAIDTSAI